MTLKSSYQELTVYSEMRVNDFNSPFPGLFFSWLSGWASFFRLLLSLQCADKTNGILPTERCFLKPHDISHHLAAASSAEYNLLPILES